ncbi:MAG: PadR family transcriptional regulator [Alphaproteobacteria bacterium]|nr:PadR family transcriptional regulator [Alphaproteobacteria bacterium]
MTRTRVPSPQTKKILSALLDEGDRGDYGYELIRRLGIKSGTLYPILMRLADQGFMEAEWRDPSPPGRPPRQVYRLTARGVELARQNPPELGRNVRASTGPATA